MKALVLSGGTGARLWPGTHSLPKQLIPLAGRPVVAHVLDSVRSLGVREAGIVVGEGGEQIERVLGDGSRFGLSLTWLRQDAPRGFGDALSLARDFLGDDDLVVYRGDTLVTGSVTDPAAAFAAARPAAGVVVPEAAPDVELVHYFTPAVHEAVAGLTAARSGGASTPNNAVRWLRAHGGDVRTDTCTGYWRRIETADDVLAAHRTLLDALTPSVDGDVDERSRITGRVVIEPGAKVVRSWIEGPAVIAAGSVVEESHIGPHATIGRECSVHGTHIDDSLVLDDATVWSVGRLHGSLIGRHAHVSAARQDGTPRRRLVVGDHTRIEVAE
ncbi:sugar phosphate nucleotidyltransferase [Streptomyces laculatispora]|uniref:Sugar phosphate nucleotidyltransferase n=1 Tax=Streptomyces laculatispora TaxID=887464 RepID=A0ABY9HZU6_9ACTN|nr:sugar phosphate nucleotidyltransferase [Streptomyces laculatispora]MBO0913739.1 NTP transferase domain-containing protein [Streptomyces laculatispora]WLQ40112.1 sugar phosphate nucleotidyltransferase [Streptomyces laculatispora]